MGVEDRDWYRDAQREREKQRQIDHTRAKSVSPIKTGLLPMMVFWCVVMGLLYLAMTHYLKPKQVQVLANGDLVINRSHDGHFYTVGSINGREVKFLVDTGASLVSVSEAFAQKALIRGGVPTTFRTANGDRLGRVVNGVGVSVGPVSLTNVRVGVGISASDENDALLGQSFLSKFDITISKNQMVLRPR